MAKQIGVFCGTFNPIHWGHLLMAESARDQGGLEEVLFITSPNPPHRKDDLLDAESRHELVEAAVSDNQLFEPSRMELDRSGGPSYTVDTLKTLAERYGAGVELNLIIGQDNLGYIGQWHKAAEIFTLCTLLVAPRVKQPAHAGAPTEEKKLPADARLTMLDIPHIPVSSSAIRSRLRNGRSVLYMVPPAVDKILREKRYYV
jgi:nicotinate-nucleotide adenylyltransferase